MPEIEVRPRSPNLSVIPKSLNLMISAAIDLMSSSRTFNGAAGASDSAFFVFFSGLGKALLFTF